MISERLLHGVNAEHAPKEEQEEIIGALAHALDTQWLLMKGQDRSQEFFARINEFVDVHNLPSFFYTQRGERRPPFPKAVRETVRRLTFIETFTASPPPTVVGEICGGSMSYGRFYNVHLGPTPYPDKDSPRKNFFNDTFIFHGREEPLPFGEVITEVPAAVFHNGAFYTGDHHNHILPKMEILYDKDGGIRKAFDAFHSALQEEFDFASKMANNGRTVDGVHIMDRAPVFSPQTVEEARGLFAQ